MLMDYSRYFGVLFRVGSIFVCMGSDSIMNLHHYFIRVLPTPEDSGLTKSNQGNKPKFLGYSYCTARDPVYLTYSDGMKQSLQVKIHLDLIARINQSYQCS